MSGWRTPASPAPLRVSQSPKSVRKKRETGTTLRVRAFHLIKIIGMQGHPEDGMENHSHKVVSPSPIVARHLEPSSFGDKNCNRNALFETSDADVMNELHAVSGLTGAFHQNALFGIRQDPGARMTIRTLPTTSSWPSMLSASFPICCRSIRSRVIPLALGLFPIRPGSSGPRRSVRRLSTPSPILAASRWHGPMGLTRSVAR
jgi:hypothetical protein